MTHRRCGVEETQLAHNWPVRRVRGHAHLLRWRRLALNKCFKMFRSMMVCPSSSNKSQIYTQELWVIEVSTDVSPTICIITLRASCPECLQWDYSKVSSQNACDRMEQSTCYFRTLICTVVCLHFQKKILTCPFLPLEWYKFPIFNMFTREHA